MVNALVVTGHGINCDGETAQAFDRAGATAERVHINELVSGEKTLAPYQIIAFPGGFSYGDDLGSGIVLANKVRSSRLYEALLRFIAEKEKLVIGICNGFQFLVKLGLLPAVGSNYREQQATLTANDSGKFENRWVHLLVNSSSPSVFTKEMAALDLVVRHGEGKFVADPETLAALQENHQIVMQYVNSHGLLQPTYPTNPNGSVANIAAVCDPTGRVLGMMPHPEANQDYTAHPQWTRTKDLYVRSSHTTATLPVRGAGLQIFKNAVGYFKR